MGNEVTQFCSGCKDLKEAFNPDLEDVNNYFLYNFSKDRTSKESKIIKIL